MSSTHDRLTWIRRALASCFAVAVLPAADLGWPSGSDAIFEWILVLAPIAAAILMWVPRFEAQLASRSVMWIVLFWTTFLSVACEAQGRRDLTMIFGGGLSSAAALALLPVSDLDAPAWTRAFRPVAFRAIIATVLVLALADAIVLALGFSVMMEGMLSFRAHHVDRDDVERAIFLGSAALMMGLAVIGLLRMRGWGFALNLVANVAIAGFAWSLSCVRWPLALALSSTAALQIVVALPLARRIARAPPSTGSSRST